MNAFTPMVKSFSILGFIFAVAGCGSAPETTSDTWSENPPVSATARLQYQVDSLTNENRRLRQQIEVLGTENRNLTAHSAELETKITEMAAAPKPEPVAVPPSGSAETGYDKALSSFKARSFTDAILEFQALLDGNVRTDLADNCHYWIGESYYGMRKYKDAVEHFKMVLGYKGSEKRDGAQMMLGNCYAAMGEKAEAREAYNTLISTYPVSPLVEKAKEKLARLK